MHRDPQDPCAFPFPSFCSCICLLVSQCLPLPLLLPLLLSLGLLLPPLMPQALPLYLLLPLPTASHGAQSHQLFQESCQRSVATWASSTGE